MIRHLELNFVKLHICLCQDYFPFRISLFSVFSAPAEKRGACVIMCSPGFGLYDDLNLPACPVDRECRSTGCGTMCYLKQGSGQTGNISDFGTVYFFLQ